MKSKIDEAYSHGYTDDEILEHLSSSNKQFAPKIHEAKQQGYAPKEIVSYLKSQQQTSTQAQDSGISGHLGRKVVSPAFEFVNHAVTAIPNFVENVGHMSTTGLNYLAKKLGYGLTDEQLKEVQNFAKHGRAVGPIPQASEVSQQFHDTTGQQLAPQNEQEQFLNRSAGVLGDIVGFGPNRALGTPLNAAGSIAASGTIAALEQNNVHPLLAAGGGILLDILTRSGGKALKDLVTNFKSTNAKALGKTVGAVGMVKPEQVRQDVIDAAQRLGIEELPPSARVNNPLLQGIESKLRQSSLAGSALENQLDRTGAGVKNAYEDISNQLSRRQDVLPSVVSEEAVNALKKTEQLGENIYRNLYDRALSPQVLPVDALVSPPIGKAIQKQLDRTLQTLKSDLGTPSKDALYNRLSRLKDSWNATAELKEGKIPINRLVTAKQDLNQVIKYETAGGADKLLNPLASTIRNGIKKYGETNKTFGSLFSGAESEFSKNAQQFRKDPIMRNLLSGNQPQNILARMDTVKGIKSLQNTLGTTVEGKQAFDALRRYKLEELVGSAILDKNGNISWAKASGILKSSKNRDILQELVGPKNYSRLKDMSKVASGIEQGIGKYANTSKTASVGLDVAFLTATIGKAIGHLFTGNYVGAAHTASYLFAPRVFANLMTNPEFIDAMESAAKAGRGPSREAFLREAKRAAAIVASEVADSGDNEVSQNDQSES